MPAADRPQLRSSLVSVDVLALRFSRAARQLELGVAARLWEPFKDQLALPGVLLGDGERLREAALRALTGKLGVADSDVRGVGQVVTFDEPTRDPRGPTLSVAMWATETRPGAVRSAPADPAQPVPGRVCP